MVSEDNLDYLDSEFLRVILKILNAYCSDSVMIKT